MTTEPSLLLIPRWAGSPQSDWYPWLRSRFPSLRVLPGLDKSATLADWQRTVTAALPSDDEQLSNTVVITHSLAMHGLILALSARAGHTSLGGALLVAAWWDIDREFWDKLGESWDAISPWLDYSFDQSAVRRQLGRAVALISDDDPIVASSAEATEQLLHQRLGCDVTVVSGHGHFNAAQEPDVASALTELLARRAT